MWQPIETVPKDGTKVDLLNKDGTRITDVFFSKAVSQFLRQEFQIKPYQLWIYTHDKGGCVSVFLTNMTHWMLSPTPPEPPKKREPRDIYLHEIDGILVNVLKPYEIVNFGLKDKLIKFREVMENNE